MTLLIHGDARGADRLAAEWALDNNVMVRPFPVNNTIDGPWPAAGVRRNARMLRESKPDFVIAFPGNTGTADMIRRARAANVPCVVVL